MNHDAFIFMIGTNPSPEVDEFAFIDCSDNPRRELQIHNSNTSTNRFTRRFAGLLRMKIIIQLPFNRRLDGQALCTHWKNRSRKPHRRIGFGIALATVLQLKCWTLPEHVNNMRHRGDFPRDLVIDEARPAPTFADDDELDALNTCTGLPVCQPGETICFTLGKKGTSGGASGTAVESAGIASLANDAGYIDWEEMVRLLVADSLSPGTMLSTTPAVQLTQANALEMLQMQGARHHEGSAAASVLINRFKKRAPQSSALSRIGVGAQPYSQLRQQVNALASSDDQPIDDGTLVLHGDECYTDANEYASRKHSRVKIEQRQLCICGARNSLTKRVAVASVIGNRQRKTRGYVCEACSRVSADVVYLRPDIAALRQTIGLPPTFNERQTMLDFAEEHQQSPPTNPDVVDLTSSIAVADSHLYESPTPSRKAKQRKTRNEQTI